MTITRFKRIRRAIWRSARDKALTRWAEAGINFTVEEGSGVVYKGFYSQDPADSYGHLLIPGVIRLVRCGKDPATGEIPRDSAMYDSVQNASIAIHGPDPRWWKKLLNYLPFVITHELGHCLGLAHRSDGGVMAGANRPDAHDLDSVWAYYAA